MYLFLSFVSIANGNPVPALPESSRHCAIARIADQRFFASCEAAIS